MTTGPAPHELAEDLHRALAVELHRRMKGTPSATELVCARRFLRDQGEALIATDEADRKRFAAIRKLYLQKLHEALQADQPSAAVLAEVLRFLTAADMVRNLGSYVEARRALATLTAADLPFQ